jgi:hypothetical protein
MHYNNDGILIQSLEHPRELPVKLSAEQAVKVPLQPLQGSAGLVKHDKQSSFAEFGYTFLNFTKILNFTKKITWNLCRSPELRQAAAQCAWAKIC